jgi:hypothetical protein
MLQNFDLTLENHAIIIKWSTASEINNEGFFLYRAKEGNDLHWQLLNQEIIAGQGNSNVRHEYEFIDAGIIEGQSYIYLLKSRDLTGQLHTLGQLRSSDLQSEQAQQTFELVQNFPNPFNNRTHFRFTLPEKGLVSLEVYDVLGRLVKRIINNKTLEASTYQQFSWDGTGDTGQSVSSGIYLYVLSFRSSATGIRQISTGKMVFIK